MKLLSPQHTNAKTAKNYGHGYHSAILYLSPGRTCPYASKGCLKACLNTAGRGAFSNVQLARKRKTNLFYKQPMEFSAQLYADLDLLVKQADKKGLKPLVRLNGTSDLDWLRFILEYPDIQFYDYTKSITRIGALVSIQTLGRAKNYHLTFSRTENNWDDCLKALYLGVNVAVVFNGPLPKTYRGIRVISGDDHDIRPLDPAGACIVGLTAKGKAKRDETGFTERRQRYSTH